MARLRVQERAALTGTLTKLRNEIEVLQLIYLFWCLYVRFCVTSILSFDSFLIENEKCACGVS